MTNVVFRVRSGTPGNWGEWSAERIAFSPTPGAGQTLRHATIDIGALEGWTVAVTEQPTGAHISVNPDNTLAVAIEGDTGTITVPLSVSRVGSATGSYSVEVTVTTGPVSSGWGTGANHYMLPVDENDRVIVEHGDVHRKVYVAPDGLTAAQIEAAESLSPGTVNQWWLNENGTSYGTTESTALHPDLGFPLWELITVAGSVTSHWLLLERGGTYAPFRILTRGADGESPLHPLFVGAWGEGAAPIVSNDQAMVGTAIKNIVLNGIKFDGQFTINTPAENIIIESVVFSDNEVAIIGNAQKVTLRHALIRDARRETPVDLNSDGVWDAESARESGMFIGSVVGVLMDGVIFDRNGWSPEYLSSGSITGGHPPSMFSHNLYGAADNRDFTFRNSISVRGASVGAQLRSGAFVENSVFIDNNVAFNVNGGGDDPRTGNYSLIVGSLVTAAAYRGADLPVVSQIGATEWGIQNEAPLTTLIGNIVTHANDPDNAGETGPGDRALNNAHALAFDDTIIYRWGSTNANIDGLNTATLNTTTIQRYTAALLGQPTATITDFAAYLRTLAPNEYKGAVADILAYFRAGFGLAETPRAVAATLRFVPDARGDGVRWDNRLNWSTGDLPGTVSGDSVNLAGNKVVFGGTVSAAVSFGAFGGLTVNHGRLTGALTGATGATLNIGNAGQVWASGASGAITTTITSGRLANTGAWLATGNLTVSGGQVILATGGATFTLAGRLDISGGAKVGFDGSSGTAALVMQSGATLGFVSTTSTLPTLGEFRSGAFGAAPAVASAVTLAGTLAVTVTDLVGTGAFTLIDVDTLTGTLAEATVTGLGSRDAAVAVNRAAGTVTLTLTAGTGEITLTHTG